MKSSPTDSRPRRKRGKGFGFRVPGSGGTFSRMGGGRTMQAGRSPRRPGLGTRDSGLGTRDSEPGTRNPEPGTHQTIFEARTIPSAFSLLLSASAKSVNPNTAATVSNARSPSIRRRLSISHCHTAPRSPGRTSRGIPPGGGHGCQRSSSDRIQSSLGVAIHRRCPLPY